MASGRVTKKKKHKPLTRCIPDRNLDGVNRTHRTTATNEDTMTIAGLIAQYGIANIENAGFRPVNRNRHTGSRPSWIAGEMLDLSNPEDTADEIVRELPDMVFLASDSSVWRVVA